MIGHGEAIVTQVEIEDIVDLVLNFQHFVGPRTAVRMDDHSFHRRGRLRRRLHRFGDCMVMIMVMIMSLLGFSGKGLHREHGKHHDQRQQERDPLFFSHFFHVCLPPQ